MSFTRALKKRGRSAVPPLLFLALAGYFGWSATQGNRGLNGYAQRQGDLVLTNNDLARAEADRTMWEVRVASLRPAHLDSDALDERGRAMLNLAEPNDIIIPYQPGQKLF